MSNYLEFTTAHNERTFGNPIHDTLPPQYYQDIDGVRVDGEVVEFKDESIPERIQRYLLESHRLQSLHIANDCIAFAALTNSVELRDLEHNPFKDFNADITIDPACHDMANSSPLVLVQGFHDGVLIPRHVAVPAHLVGQQNYVHKLGDNGPLCMSNLRDALTIMHCTSAHPVLATG